MGRRFKAARFMAVTMAAAMSVSLFGGGGGFAPMTVYAEEADSDLAGALLEDSAADVDGAAGAVEDNSLNGFEVNVGEDLEGETGEGEEADPNGEAGEGEEADPNGEIGTGEGVAPDGFEANEGAGLTEDAMAEGEAVSDLEGMAVADEDMLDEGGALAAEPEQQSEEAEAKADLYWNLADVEDKSYEEDFAVGGFTVKAASGKAVEVKSLTEGNAVYSEEGTAFAKVLELKGSGSQANRSIAFTLNASAIVTVYARSGGDADRVLRVLDEDNDELVTVTAVGNSNTTLQPETFVLEPGTYYLWSKSGGINIYDIRITPNLDMASALERLEAQSLTEGSIVEGDFEFIAGGSKVDIQDISANPVSSDDGLTFTKAFSLGGSGSKTKRAIKFSLDTAAVLNVYALSGGAAGRPLRIVDEAGVQHEEITVEAKGTSVKAVEVALPAGTYYVYSGNSGIVVYDICVKPEETEELTPWDEVEVPRITSVTTDNEGNFVVEFEAQIGKTTGAEEVRITMSESGHEVSTQIVSNDKETSVIFQPLWSGNYTFVAVARRTGEADKASETVFYDNYALAVQKPVIAWAQNKGGGTLYLDWVNIEDADSYTVYYKKTDAGEYTTAASGLTAGNYTLSGLEVGATYEIRVEAVRNSDNFVAFATKEVTITSGEEQPWYVAIIGSAQGSTTSPVATITDGNGEVKEYPLGKNEIAQVADISNNNGSAVLAGFASGKISDDEDGFTYYYTKINPDTENFKLSAKFKVVDISLTPDNQTGFGLVAADTLGVNNWGEGDVTHKYFNYFSSMYYSNRNTTPVMRIVTGYESADTSNIDGVEREVTNSKFNDVTADFTVGNEYTFTLEKTDDGYVAAVNGSEQTYEDNSFTSVQEDGTVCVGLMVSRKVSVEVTGVTFEKTDSEGITSAGDKNEVVTPNATVYSYTNSGAKEYEYIYVPNCAGALTITGPSGTVFDDSVSANQVVRVMVPINTGANTITAVLVPAAGNVTSTDAVTKTITVNCKRYGEEGNTLIVAADGTENGNGTEESPLDIATAVKYVQPGQTIYMKEGVYTGGIRIERSVSGTADKNITLLAEPGVMLEGAGLTIVGSYWHVYGLYIKDSASVGIQISGNYNIIEMCTVEGSKSSGIQISRSNSADREAGINGMLWPTGNLIKNCESFDNCDDARNDADGFAAKLTCGNDNVFYGCISHHNIDDGWDLYAKSISGEIGAVRIENCVAYSNGWLTEDEDEVRAGTFANYGEGNGFKLGGGYLKGGHVLINSVSFNNHAKGITSNSCPDCQIINCTAYNNGAGIGLNSKASAQKEWVVTGLISMNVPENSKEEDGIPFSLASTDNYIYNGSASYNTLGEQALDSWFESVDVTNAPARNEDGTINMHGLLVLNDTAPATSGGRLDTVSETAKSVAPEKGPVTDGNIEEGNETGAETGWKEEDGIFYWYEDGVKQGTEGRGKEIYDPASDAWYWLEAEAGGSMAKDKDVFVESNGGKWVRYNAEGKMVKGWNDKNDSRYYFDLVTGAMAKGTATIEGETYYFDEITGKLQDTGTVREGWYNVDGRDYWYEGGVRQGYDANNPSYRGKEIYDFESGAWYWLDNSEYGAKAVGKDVYLESADGSGKWMRFDENGQRVKGWQTTDAGTYYFDEETGAMAKGEVVIEGKNYNFDAITGIMQ